MKIFESEYILDVITKRIRKQLIPPPPFGATMLLAFDPVQTLYVDDYGHKWLQFNGATIGKPGSGAEVEDLDLQRIFVELWLLSSTTIFPNRGFSANEDFNGDKLILLPDARGRNIKAAGAGSLQGLSDFATLQRGGAEEAYISQANLPDVQFDCTVSSNSHNHTGSSGGYSHYHTGTTGGSNQNLVHADNSNAQTRNDGNFSRVVTNHYTAGHTHGFTTGWNTHSHSVTVNSSSHGHTATVESGGANAPVPIENPYICLWPVVSLGKAV